MFKVLLHCVLLAVALAGFSAPGIADGDHDRARAAVQAGRVVPLRDLLDEVARDFKGDMLEVELDEDDGRLVYHLKLLTPDGSILKLLYDARTKELIAAKGRGVKNSRRE